MLEVVLVTALVWALLCPREFGEWLGKIDAGRSATLKALDQQHD